MLIAINHHYVRPSYDAPYSGIHGITPAQLERQLRIAQRWGTIIRPSALRDAVVSGAPLPDPAILVTFDDGLREQYEHAQPVLQSLGIEALFFINTAPLVEQRVSAVHKIHLLRAHVPPDELGAEVGRRLENVRLQRPLEVDAAVAQYRYDSPAEAELKFLLNFCLAPGDRDALIDALFPLWFPSEAAVAEALYMTPSMLADLGRHQQIGNHSHRHVPLSTLDAAELEAELRTSTEALETHAGYRPYAFSYPYGTRAACSREVAARVAAHGYEVGFTTERAVNRDLKQPLLLARFDNNDLPGGKACALEPAHFLATAAAPVWFRD